MKYTSALFIAILVICTMACYAQNRSGNVWCFGTYDEVNFNSGVPVAGGPTQMASMSGTASIADSATGQLLFYTDGIHVWDNTNTVMPGNTTSLGALQSFGGSTTPALIVPKPGNSKQYYIFTTGAALSYTIIDMTLHGGKGDISQQPSVLLSDSVSVLSGTRKQGGGYWLVTHTRGNNKFYAYPVTNSGIGSAVVSAQGDIDYNDTYLKMSPDGSKLAIVLLGATTAAAEVCTFNHANGAVAQPFFTDNTLPNVNTGSTFGVSFSPNSMLLYVGITFDSTMYQYNLASGNQSNIMASKYGITTTYNPGPGNSASALQLGPDLKLYVCVFDSHQLDAITYPDVPGSGCQYQANAINVTGNLMAGLVNYMDCIFTEGSLFPLQILTSGTSVNCGNTCNGTVNVTATDGHPPYSYHWSTGNTTTSSINNLCAGAYRVTVTDSAGTTVSSSFSIMADTTHLHITASNYYNSQLTEQVSCTDQTQLSIPNIFNSINWSNGEAYYEIYPFNPGLYWVTVTDSNNCNLVSDSVFVHQSPANPVVNRFGDTVIVHPQSTQSLQWYYGYNHTPIPGQTSDTIVFSQPGGVYFILTDTNGCELLRAYNNVGIRNVAADNITISPNPSTDGYWQLHTTPAFAGCAYEIYNLTGQMVYRSVISNAISGLQLDVPPGNYVLTIHAHSGDASAILVKQ